jgi:hypothetical protein
VADSAEFFQTPVADTSPDRNGADPSGGRMKCYQMVPVGGSRECKIRLSGKIQLAAQHPSLVKIGKPGAALGPDVSFDSLALQEFPFIISSVSGAGRTQIIAAKADGTVLDRLIVSVKAERLLTYNIHRLQDIARLTSRGFPELQTFLGKVEKYYLNQANLRLIRKRTQTLLIRNDLGDPLDPTTNKMKLIDEEMVAGKFYMSTLNVISTWDLRDNFLSMNLEGYTPFALQITFRPQIVLVRATAEHQEVNTYAHEIGHALGLQHDGQPDNFLMNGAGNLGYAMRAIDIDRINPSGAVATP